jgi:hypothetical protein
LPEYRKGWNALKLLSLMESECEKRGAKEIQMTAELGNYSGTILEDRRYGKVSVNYCKSLGRAKTAQSSLEEAVT